ncbi:MAG: AAA family ATPase [Phycisphaerales bacterium]|nr:AAA family ATPase [Phycisphaerales bacterium]MCI0631818.1 AAA family ATPase [Phycisphaerales bacterium]MCI0675815.1 AAA family ATPase [Phycisphaerales bacterium]
MAATPATLNVAHVEAAAKKFREDYIKTKKQIQKAIVGHEEIIDGVLMCLFAGGHALLEGVPGLGKTLLIRSLSEALHLQFNRIQFTPDLMPADVTGTTIVVETEHGREFQFRKGPIFAQIVLADEINRATPKTQSSLLEAMQEKSVTVGGTTYQLDKPFFVMATQNPIEQEGTYPLPEAQLDRFFFKLEVGYSGRAELAEILNRTTAGTQPKLDQVLDGPTILEHQQLVRRVVIAPHVQDYAVRLVLATHPQGELATPMVNQFLRFGASPRAAQALVLAGKVRALLDARPNVSIEDIRGVVLPAMRHRCLLNFEGEAEGMQTDTVLQNVVETMPVDVSVAA